MAPYTIKTTGDEIAKDCKDRIANKTILITGASPKGLGATFITTIAPYGPKLIILASRNLEKANQTVKDIATVAPDSVKVEVVQLDLSSQKSVREGAANILKISTSIDVLVNDAGIMAVPYSTTPEGIERQFGTNHIGHFLLTNLLLPTLLETREKTKDEKAPLRVVNVASNGFRFGFVRFEDWNFGDGEYYDRWEAYSQSKSANMLFTRSLAQKLGQHGVVSVSLHPGVIMSTSLTNDLGLTVEDFSELGVRDHKLGNRSFFDETFDVKTPAEGIATHVFAAFHPSLDAPEINGSYLKNSQVEDVKLIQSWARDLVEAEKLWNLSEQLVSETFSY